MRVSLSFTEKGIELVGRLHCPAKHISTSLSFVIDTGSEMSYLGWDDAETAGLDSDQLPRYYKPVLGFGGAAEAKHLREQCFVYAESEDKDLQQVEFPNGILVYRPSKRKKRRWVAGKSVSILGRDFMIYAGWRLSIDAKNKIAYFEA